MHDKCDKGNQSKSKKGFIKSLNGWIKQTNDLLQNKLGYLWNTIKDFSMNKTLLLISLTFSALQLLEQTGPYIPVVGFLA